MFYLGISTALLHCEFGQYHLPDANISLKHDARGISLCRTNERHWNGTKCN